MNQVSLAVFSNSLFLIFMVLGVPAMNDFGCNGVYYYYRWYGVDVCYPDTTSSGVESFMYICNESDGTLMEYEYSTRDCSGNVSSSLDWTSYAYAYCSSSYNSDCDYFYIISYDGDSYCDESGTEYDVYSTQIVNVCVNTTSSSFGNNINQKESKYVTCNENSYTVKYWNDSDNCTGNYVYSYTYDPLVYNFWFRDYDFKFYCSSVGEESQCNENSETNGSSSYYGCNGVYFANTWFGVDACYPDTTSSRGVSSSMYICESDGKLIQYEYSTRDCSGNVSDTTDWISSWRNEYAYCKPELSNSDCNYVSILYYDGDSNCDENGTVYNLYDNELVNICMNTTRTDYSEGVDFEGSKYMTCSQDSYNVKYWNNSNCSGDYQYSWTYDPQWYRNDTDFKYDFKFYCSSLGVESECNENGSRNNDDDDNDDDNDNDNDNGTFSMNNKYVVGLIANLFGLVTLIQMY